MRLLFVLFAVVFGPVAAAQTKGMNTVGAGFSFGRSELTAGPALQVNKTNGLSLEYGHFIRDHVRLGVNTLYILSRSESNGFESESRNYGGGLSLQRYYPLLKKFYAFVGGSAAYTRLETTTTQDEAVTAGLGSNYGVAVSGGATYFLSKRFAVETTILSGGADYAKIRNVQDGAEARQRIFSLSTSGTFTNLGFKVFILF